MIAASFKKDRYAPRAYFGTLYVENLPLLNDPLIGERVGGGVPHFQQKSCKKKVNIGESAW